MVATAGVVVLAPALGLGVEVSQASEVLAVEGRAGEPLGRGAMGAWRRALGVGGGGGGGGLGRNTTVADAEVRKVAGERRAGELGAVVGQHPGELGADAGEALGDKVDEAGGGGCPAVRGT